VSELKISALGAFLTMGPVISFSLTVRSSMSPGLTVFRVLSVVL
jgi:hypothetical protein